MRSIGHVLLCAVAFRIASSAAFSRRNELVARTCPADLDSIPQTSNVFNQVINNVTLLFTWQMTAIVPGIGPANMPSSLSNLPSDSCENFDQAEYKGRYADDGLNPAILKSGFCTRQSCGIAQDTTNILNHIRDYVAAINTVQLLNIWKDRKSALPIVCKNLGSARVQALLHGSTDLIKNVCLTADPTGHTVPITGVTPFTSTDLAEFAEIKKSSSELFAWELLGTLQFSGTVKDTCSHRSTEFSSAVNNTGLVADSVLAVLCAYPHFSTIPTAGEVKTGIVERSTHVFVGMLWNIGVGDEYRQLICKGYSVKQLANLSGYGMLNVGLDWQQVMTEVAQRCTDAKVSDT